MRTELENVDRFDLNELSAANPFIEGPKWIGQKPEEDIQIFYHYDGVTPFTEEEIAEANANENKRTEEALVIIEKDGFVPFPIFFYDVNGVFVERTAWIHPEFEPSCSVGFKEKHGMNFNIYIPSYGREKELLTAKMNMMYGVENWYLAVDPSQYLPYKTELEKLGVSSKHIVIRDPYFRDEKMVDITTSMVTPNYTHGTSGIYNFLLAFSTSIGEKTYFTQDDDFVGMAMKAKKGDEMMKADEAYDKNNYYRCSNLKEEYGFDYKRFMGSLGEVMDKARNPGFAALEKFGLVFSLPIFWKLGTRAYSCYLTRNETQVAHLGAFNNDVTTSLEMSKRGFVNMLFEGINYNSEQTQKSGGLADDYRRFGTLEKGKRLVKTQPNYAKITERYSRIHHAVDYTVYNGQRLVGAAIQEDPNNEAK